VSVSSGSNASILSVTLSYTGGSSMLMTHIGSGVYRVTTPELTSSSTTFTVTVTDSRGMSASANSSAITVVQYSPPSLNVDAGATFRCTQLGNPDSGGAYFLTKAAASYYTSLSGNALLQFNVKIQGTQTTYNLTSGVQGGPYDGNLVATTNYTLEFTIEDKVSAAVTKTFPLGSKIRDLVAIHNSTGTAFGVGTTPQRTAGSSVELPAGGVFLIGDIPAQSLSHFGSDLQDGTSFNRDFLAVEVNTMYDSKNMEAAFNKPALDSLWSNIPTAKAGTNWIGVRKVLWLSGSCILVDIEELWPYPGQRWTNYYNGSTWNGWRHTNPAT